MKKLSPAPAPINRSRNRIRSSSAPIVRYRAAEPPPILATAPDGRRYCGIPYADCYFYFDTVKYLTKIEINEADRAWLRSHCKHLDIRRHGSWVRAKRGHRQVNIWPWRLRIECHLPDRAALAFFAKLRDTKLTAAHLARDFTFEGSPGKWAMLDLFSGAWVQPHLKNDLRIIFDNGGFSTGRRAKGTYFTAYADLACRIDGITDCWHFEQRSHGTKALAQANLHEPADLIDFDHERHWEVKDRECLRWLDKRTLGRTHRNRQDKTRDQQSAARDLRIGGLLWRIFGTDEFGNSSVQHFIRGYGRGPFIRELRIQCAG
ncbi:hypothetical protein JQ543_30735 [Bradyrhizobium diazoefficiens]|nr:hypothetical protein [Bradyrhizobium diazoefficiens]MBR0852147.1 hypothetical protein [Bradyrhizobium diazoefficiens]